MHKPFQNHGHHISFKAAVEGLFFAFKTEINMKLIVFFALLAIMLSLSLPISYSEWLVIFLTIMIVFVAEMINSSIEAVCDLITQDWNENVKIAKDVAAGTVLLASFFAVLIGLVIFLPKIINLLSI